MESSNSGILEPNYEEKFNIPSQFQIIEYAYTKKDISKKGVCYRCQNRNKCSLTLVIEIKEFKKFLIKLIQKIYDIKSIVDRKFIQV